MRSKIDISVDHDVRRVSINLVMGDNRGNPPPSAPHSLAASTEYHETRGPDERRTIGSCKSEAMSSGFVSGGTADDPIERSDEWLAAQKELEENRARRAAAAQQPGERSLYEILEANKGISKHAHIYGTVRFGAGADHVGVR
jgi:hypothetical protein